MKKYNLDSVELHITDACTHRCPYCYADAKLTPISKYADLATIKRIIDELAVSGVKVVALLGGDPVRHPHFVSIAEYVKQCGMRVACMSNTMVVENHSIERLATIIDSIDTTVHAPTPEEHDAFCRCPGAYDLLMGQLEAYSHLGVTVNIAINIIPQTYDRVYDIVKGVISRNVMVDTLLTQRILPFGRAKNSIDYDVVASQVNAAFAQIESAVNDYGIGVSVEDPYPLCCIEKKFWRFMHGCPEGITRIAVSLDGDVSRCGAVPDYSLGNILSESLLDIWNNSKAFDLVRTGCHLTLQECEECEYKEQCCGGCPISCEMCHSLGKNFIHEFKRLAHETY